MPYRQLRAGEIINEGDEVDGAADGWRDEPRWEPTKCAGEKAPDPQCPAHRRYRRWEACPTCNDQGAPTGCPECGL